MKAIYMCGTLILTCSFKSFNISRRFDVVMSDGNKGDGEREDGDENPGVDNASHNHDSQNQQETLKHSEKWLTKLFDHLFI